MKKWYKIGTRRDSPPCLGLLPTPQRPLKKAAKRVLGSWLEAWAQWYVPSWFWLCLLIPVGTCLLMFIFNFTESQALPTSGIHYIFVSGHCDVTLILHQRWWTLHDLPSIICPPCHLSQSQLIFTLHCPYYCIYSRGDIPLYSCSHPFFSSCGSMLRCFHEILLLFYMTFS